MLYKINIMKNMSFQKLIKYYTTYKRNLPEFDFEYLCNADNRKEIENNIKIRKGVGNIDKVNEIYKDVMKNNIKSSEWSSHELANSLILEAKKIPNRTHRDVRDYGTEPKTLKFLNEKPKDLENANDFSQITKNLNIMRTEHLGNFTGHRSYYFMDSLAELEEALIKYSIGNLLSKGFQLVSVPDILPSHIIESCGMAVSGERSQIYSLDESHHGPELCLSGTAEMSLAGLLMNTEHSESSLPLKLAAVSRCYRAETSNLLEERGIYRVHQFTKVEMFGVCSPNSSDALLEEFRELEEQSFMKLGLHMRVLDMPPHELGAPAYRKYDIEAWMPGRKMFGEISSCSNCTDYQSRRLHIKYIEKDSSVPKFVHTLNGTACAVPRMLIALLETHQQSNGSVLIPEVLRKYMNNNTHITKRKAVPQLKMVKLK